MDDSRREMNLKHEVVSSECEHDIDIFLTVKDWNIWRKEELEKSQKTHLILCMRTSNQEMLSYF